MTMFSSLFLVCFIISLCINALAIRIPPNNTRPEPTILTRTLTIPLVKRYHKTRIASWDMKSFNSTTTIDQKTSYSTEIFDEQPYIYVAYFKVGFPPQDNSFLVDTGSDLMWLQCEPCIHCFTQTGNIFSPSNSISYKEIGCSSAQCDHQKIFIQDCKATMYGTSKQDCRFEYFYVDESHCRGKIITETLTFRLDGYTVDNIVMGCANNNKGIYPGSYNGILGIGRGSYSLISQLKATNFSFCLPGPNFNIPSTLDIPYTGPDNHTIITPLLVNQFYPTYYYVGFKGISLNDEMVDIPSSYWDIVPPTNQGVIMDSGTPLTRFPKHAYFIFRDEFLDLMSPDLDGLHFPFLNLDVCFFHIPDDNKIPKVKFHFTDTGSLTLTREQVLVCEEPDGTYVCCLAFLPTNDYTTILGSKQLQGTRQTYDLTNLNLKLTPNDCYSDPE